MKKILSLAMVVAMLLLSVVALIPAVSAADSEQATSRAPRFVAYQVSEAQGGEFTLRMCAVIDELEAHDQVGGIQNERKFYRFPHHGAGLPLLRCKDTDRSFRSKDAQLQSLKLQSIVYFDLPQRRCLLCQGCGMRSYLPFPFRLHKCRFLHVRYFE